MDYPELLKGYKNELVKLQEILLKERENRETDEHHAIELLTRVKEQYDLRFRQMKSDYVDQIKELEQRIGQLVEQQQQLESELQEEQASNRRLLASEQQLKMEVAEARSSEETIPKIIWVADAEQPKKPTDEQRDDTQRPTTSKDGQRSNGEQAEQLERLKRDLEEMEIKLTHKENELSNVKLDLRMAQREVNRNQDHTKFLRESNRELKEKVTSLENQLKEHESVDSSKVTEVNNLKTMYEAAQAKNEQLSERLKTLDDEKQSLSDEISNLRETMKNKDDLLSKSRATNLKLKQVCEKLEGENEQLNAWFDDQAAEKERYQSERDDHLKTIGDLNKKVADLQSKLDRTEQQLERQTQEFREKEQSLQKGGQQQLDTLNELKAKLENEIENNRNYVREIKRLEAECFSKETELERYEKKISEMLGGLNAIKEERSQNLTISESLRQQNYSLAKMYDDLSKKYSLVKNRVSELLAENDRKDTNFEIETLKFEQKVSQQAKLIDHLTDRLEKASKKVNINFTLRNRT